MTREWKVGDRVRALDSFGVWYTKGDQGVVTEIVHGEFAVVFDGASRHVLFRDLSVLEKVSEGKEQRSRTISPMVVRGYSICDPRDNSELQVTLCNETRYEASYILVRREYTDEVMTFDGDLEELKTLLEVAKKLLQKE